MQVYVIPILTYRLEIFLPSRTELQTLEIFYRKILKQILSIPTNTADPAVYIMAGAIPIESRIHKLALGMYANICRTTNSIEREIAERQLGMKAINDNSWFSKLKQILAIYELPSSRNILDLPPTKNARKKMVNKAVRERPFNLKEGGLWFFSKKNILTPNVAEKDILILVEEKKII